jgi:hypothetical protein
MNRTAELTIAVERALRAPSVHNTQPSHWRIEDDAVQLHADWTRHLVATDPDRRNLILSCGAALHHLLVALAARGLEAQVGRRVRRGGPQHHVGAPVPRPWTTGSGTSSRTKRA